jgi:hypothetical protein
MARTLLNASRHRPLRLTRRLLAHHLLWREFMPDHPILQGAGLRQAAPLSGPRLLTALPVDEVREESDEEERQLFEEAFPEERRELEPGEESRVAPFSAAHEIPPASEASAPMPEAMTMQMPLQTGVPAVRSADAPPIPRPQRPWKQRVAEITDAEERPETTVPPFEQTHVVEAPQATPPTVHPPLPEPSSLQAEAAEKLDGPQQPAQTEVRSGFDETVLPPDAAAAHPAEQTISTKAPEEGAGVFPNVEPSHIDEAVTAIDDKRNTNVSQNPTEKTADGRPDLPGGTETLFADTGQDRSPQAWAARLNSVLRPPGSADVSLDRQTLAETDATAELTSSNAEVEPLRESSRRFLQPLVGFDPTDVRVHRGPAAEHIAADLHSDALTHGEDIYLSAGHAGETPEDLGLLAHELTHVARNRAPDFIPPVARRTEGVPEKPGPAVVSPVSEETLAVRVESRVRSAAQQAGMAPSASRSTVAPVNVPERGPLPPEDAPTSLYQPGVVPAVPVPHAEASPWSGLPAPWEPLPDWMAPALGAPRSDAVDSAVGGLGAAMPGPEIHLAGEERSVETPAEPSAPVLTHSAAATPEADLDRLAQQVYNRLKQRLSAERRREWR